MLGTTNAIDEWVLRRANTSGTEVAHKADGAALDISNEARVAYLNEWFNENVDAAMKDKWVDSIGEVLGMKAAELRADYTARLHQLNSRLHGACAWLEVMMRSPLRK